MTKKNWKDNISFILIEPGEPGNIGAVARAMKNMGFYNLELVQQKNHEQYKAFDRTLWSH